MIDFLFKNELLKKIIISLIIMVVAILVYQIIKVIIKRSFKFRLKKSNPKKIKTIKIFFANIIKIVILLIALMIILEVFGVDTKVIITSLGAVTVVIGLAFQDMLKDFISGISLVFENSYNIGDWVTINSFKGEVIYIGMKTTRLRAYGGEVFIINNGSINEVINHTMSNSVAIVDVGVSYDSDLNKVEKILNKLFEKLNGEIETLKSEIKLLGVEDLGNSSVVYRIIAEVEPNGQFDVQRRLRKEIKQEFDKNSIEIPFNQIVVHNKK